MGRRPVELHLDLLDLVQVGVPLGHRVVRRGVGGAPGCLEGQHGHDPDEREPRDTRALHFGLLSFRLIRSPSVSRTGRRRQGATTSDASVPAPWR
jgi:hypothetical protein